LYYVVQYVTQLHVVVKHIVQHNTINFVVF